MAQTAHSRGGGYSFVAPRGATGGAVRSPPVPDSRIPLTAVGGLQGQAGAGRAPMHSASLSPALQSAQSPYTWASVAQMQQQQQLYQQQAYALQLRSNAPQYQQHIAHMMHAQGGFAGFFSWPTSANLNGASLQQTPSPPDYYRGWKSVAPMPSISPIAPAPQELYKSPAPPQVSVVADKQDPGNQVSLTRVRVADVERGNTTAYHPLGRSEHPLAPKQTGGSNSFAPGEQDPVPLISPGDEVLRSSKSARAQRAAPPPPPQPNSQVQRTVSPVRIVQPKVQRTPQKSAPKKAVFLPNSSQTMLPRYAPSSGSSSSLANKPEAMPGLNGLVDILNGIFPQARLDCQPPRLRTRQEIYFEDLMQGAPNQDVGTSFPLGDLVRGTLPTQTILAHSHSEEPKSTPLSFAPSPFTLKQPLLQDQHVKSDGMFPRVDEVLAGLLAGPGQVHGLGITPKKGLRDEDLRPTKDLVENMREVDELLKSLSNHHSAHKRS